MKRLSILGAAVLAALFAVESLAWDFLYMTPLGGRWVRSENPLQVEEYDHRTEGRMSPLVEELGENAWRLYTVWNRTEYTCVDGSVAMPDGYDITVYSPKTNALAIAAHKADKENPHEVTIRQADAAGGDTDGLAAVLGEMGIVADGEGVDFPTQRPTWAGEGLATTGEVAEVESTASTALTTAEGHAANTSNPHNVTAAQIGALTAETDPAWTEAKPGLMSTISNLSATVAAIGGGGTGSVASVAAALVAHETDTDNPHNVTAEQIGALTEEEDPNWGAQSNAVLTAIGELQGKTNTFTEAYTMNGYWVVDDPVDFEHDVAFAGDVTAGDVNAISLTLGGTTVTNWGQVTGADAAALAEHLADTNNPHGVTIGQLDEDGEVEQYLRDHGLNTTYDPYQQKATLNLVDHELFMGEKFVGTFRLVGGANGGDYRFEAPVEFSDGATIGGEDVATAEDVTEVADALSEHISATNPHGVTAAQLGALPTTGGTMLDGTYIYFGGANDYLYGGSDGITLETSGQVTMDAGETVVSGPFTAEDGITASSITMKGTTVTSWTNTPDFAANAAHRAATNNPHGVTIGQLDADGALRSYLSSKYRLWLDPTYGVDVMQGFGHYISLEENCWVNTNASDFLMVSSNQTWDFRTDGPPTYFGTNLATMTDLSVAVADLAPQSWVQSQIATSVAGQYTTLQQFNNHTDNTNAHGLAALRAQVGSLPTTSFVMDYVDGVVNDLGDVATQEDLANYVPATTYTAATNALWGAFDGMATDADIATATSGLAAQSTVTALDGRVSVLESAAFGPDGVDFSGLVDGLVAVSGRVDTAESDIAALQEVAGAAWPTNPAADDRVVFPKMSYYQNSYDLTVIDPGFYDQSIAPHRSGAISNLALLQASKVEASKMMVHGDPVLASTQFTSNYIAGNSIISMPRTFTATNDVLWCHYNYPDYMGKLHFVWSNAYYTEVVTNYTVVTNGGAVTTNETTATVTNHYQPTVSLTITATNAANEEVSFTVIPRLDGQDQEIYIDRTPLYLIRGFYISPNSYPIPTPATDPVLIGFWYEKPATYGDEFDFYGKVLKVDEPDEARGVANKAYVDSIVGGVDLRAIYNRDGTTQLNGNDVVFNPRYALTFSNNDMTISYGGFPVMTFKGGMKVVPVMTALSSSSNTLYAYCTGTADSELRLQWCTNLEVSAEGGVVFEDVPDARITAQYMTDEYTWCTEIDATGIRGLWMRAWLQSLLHSLTDVEMETEDGTQSFAELFAKVAALQGATNLYAMAADLAAHAAATNNPHNVTAAQIGALTSESDTAALAALATASNALRQAITDVGNNLPGLSDFAARLAALEAWKNGSQSGGITSNEVFTGVAITALTNLGETAWTDVAIASETANAVFVGEDSYIWEERASGNRTIYTNLLPKLTWKSATVGADGKMAVALPSAGRAYIRTAQNGQYAQDTGSVRIAYWDGGAVASGGAFGAVAGHKGLFTVTSNKVWRAFTNETAGTEYGDAFATATGDILFSGDRSGGRKFALVTGAQGVIAGQLPLPSGVSTNARVVTRTPSGANRATETASGVDDWPVALDSTNKFTYKVTGGPWLDVMVDGTTPHPLYVRGVAKWQENTYAKIDTGAREVVTNWTVTDTFRGFYKKYRYRDGNNVWILLPQHGEAPEEYDATGYKTVWVPDALDEYDLGTLGSDDYRLGDPDRYVVCTDTSNVNTAEGYINYDRTSYGYQTYKTADITTNPVVSLVSTSSNRLVEAYEPITAAGNRCWVDAAVSMDPEMRRIWAVEANGNVWRMTGSSWRTGTWTSQTGPGTNMWTQVVCNADGSRAIAVGDCMVPTGATYGTGADAVPLEANAWYFDGSEWHALAHPVRKLDGTVGCVKWKKAYLSQTGYTAYLLPEGTGYVHKMAYH